MANYYCTTRTNYFSVTDPDKLKKLVDKISGAELWDNGEGKYAFGGYDEPITEYYEESEDGTEDISIFPELQELLPDGEAVILTEVGNEKLRYLVAVSYIITNKAIEAIELETEAVKKAVEMTGDPSKTFRMDY